MNDEMLFLQKSREFIFDHPLSVKNLRGLCFFDIDKILKENGKKSFVNSNHCPCEIVIEDPTKNWQLQKNSLKIEKDFDLFHVVEMFFFRQVEQQPFEEPIKLEILVRIKVESPITGESFDFYSETYIDLYSFSFNENSKKDEIEFQFDRDLLILAESYAKLLTSYEEAQTKEPFSLTTLSLRITLEEADLDIQRFLNR